VVIEQMRTNRDFAGALGSTGTRSGRGEDQLPSLPSPCLAQEVPRIDVAAPDPASGRGGPERRGGYDEPFRYPDRRPSSWSTLVHTPSEPSGSQRSPSVSSGRSFAQVADAILRKQARGQNPDKDEVGGSTPPRPTTGGDQRKRWSTYPELVRRGVYLIKTSYLITGPRHRPRRRAAIPTRAVCGRTPLLPAGRPALGVGGHAPLGPAHPSGRRRRLVVTWVGS
jgi:hypothetical protein